MVDEKLVEGLIETMSVVLKNMEDRNDDLYWYGQFTANLDSHNISIFDLINNKKLVAFDRE